MSAHANNRKDKREIQFSTHNRRPGIAKFWKHMRNRRSRRRNKRLNSWQVEGRVNLQ